MINFFKSGGKWRPARIAGVLILLICLAGSCTGQGCKGCTACESCSSCKPPAGGPGGVTQPGVLPGGTSQPGAQKPAFDWTKETRPSPYRPVTVLSSDTARYVPTAEQQEAAKKLLREIEAKGQGENPPAAPLNLNAQDVKGVSVSLTWTDASNNEQEFQVDRSEGGGPFVAVFRLPANSASVMDGPLAKGTYSYRVRAANDTGASAFAGPAAVTLAGADSAPAAPVALTADADATPQVMLLWEDQSDNEEYFKVERSEGRGPFAAIATLGVNANSYNDPMVQDKMTYTYRVIAGNKAGESAPTNTASVKIKVADKPPAAPTNLQAVTGTDGGVTLQWDDNSDNEDRFVVEQSTADVPKFRRFAETDQDQPAFSLQTAEPGEAWNYQIRAENAAGTSDPSNVVTVTGKDKPVTAFTITVDPSGNVAVTPPSNPSLPSLVVQSSAREGADIVAEIAVRNSDPENKLEEVYVLVEDSDQSGVMLQGCDRGPGSCALDEGIASGSPVGYQYVEGGYDRQVLHGGEMEHYPSQQGLSYAVRNIWPACGSVAVKWTFSGVTATTQLGVNLYGNVAPGDLRRGDARFDRNKLLFMIEPFAPGPATELYKPGALPNPTSRHINFLKPGDVVAVNVSVEAADWMENQPEIGRLADEPNADYIYWHDLGFGITFDPAVIQPISKSVVMPDGSVLYKGIQDPMTAAHIFDDGWNAENGQWCFSYMVPNEGVVVANFSYASFEIGQNAQGQETCVHCGQEGFVDANGVITGPDPEPEATLGLIYFQVVGPPGSGTPLRLFPRPMTFAIPYSTKGTIRDWHDDQARDWSLEISTQLPMTGFWPGEYQANESFICVQ
ncbi:MAG TPA: hypothetical protein VM658_10670 [bacterium]|nr:hypothetical protein [bacterium]